MSEDNLEIAYCQRQRHTRTPFKVGRRSVRRRVRDEPIQQSDRDCFGVEFPVTALHAIHLSHRSRTGSLSVAVIPGGTSAQENTNAFPNVRLNHAAIMSLIFLPSKHPTFVRLLLQIGCGNPARPAVPESQCLGVSRAWKTDLRNIGPSCRRSPSSQRRCAVDLPISHAAHELAGLESSDCASISRADSDTSRRPSCHRP